MALVIRNFLIVIRGFITKLLRMLLKVLAELIPGPGLDDVHILSSDRLLNLDDRFAVGFVIDGTAAKTNFQMPANNNFNSIFYSCGFLAFLTL